MRINVAVWGHIRLLRLPDTWVMTPDKQHGDVFPLSTVVFSPTLKPVANTRSQWVELFPSVKLQNGYVNGKMAPELTPTKR